MIAWSQSESICLDRRALTWPCVWNEGTFRLHMEQSCCHMDLLFVCFAECEIAFNLFVVVLHFGAPGIQAAPVHPFCTPVLCEIWHHYVKRIRFIEIVIELADICLIIKQMVQYLFLASHMSLPELDQYIGQSIFYISYISVLAYIIHQCTNIFFKIIIYYFYLKAPFSALEDTIRGYIKAFKKKQQ